MTARQLLLIAAALLHGASPSARSDEPPAAASLANCQEAMKSINAEVENSITIFREAVKAGREEDGWSAEVKEAASQWVKSDPRMIKSIPPTQNEFAARQAAMASFMRPNAILNEGKLAWPASELAEW